MDLSLRSLATDISQRVVQYYRDNKTSLVREWNQKLRLEKAFLLFSISRIIMGEITIFLKPASEKKREEKLCRYIYDILS